MTCLAGTSEAGVLWSAMSLHNQQEERERLEKLYAGKTNEELEKFARDPNALTEVAKAVLGQELTRRGMAWPVDSAVDHPKPVMLRRFRDLPEATVAQSVLESAGIESFLADDNLVRLDWFYSNLIGGVKLFVAEVDVDSARELLDQSAPEAFNVEGVGEYKQPHCPRCDSLDVSYDGLDKPASYAGFFLNVPRPVRNRGWKCHTCGHAWDDNQESEALDG